MFTTEIDVTPIIQLGVALPVIAIFTIGLFGVIIKKFIHLMKG